MNIAETINDLKLMARACEHTSSLAKKSSQEPGDMSDVIGTLAGATATVGKLAADALTAMEVELATLRSRVTTLELQRKSSAPSDCRVDP